MKLVAHKHKRSVLLLRPSIHIFISSQPLPASLQTWMANVQYDWSFQCTSLVYPLCRSGAENWLAVTEAGLAVTEALLTEAEA